MNSQRVPWGMVTLLCATATASYMCRVNVSTAGVLIMDEFSLNQVDMGRIISAFILGYALFQIPAGILADRLGARRVLTWAAFLWAVITIIQAIVGSGFFEISSSATTLFVFVLFRFLLGVSESPTYPASAQGVSRWVIPKFQGRANGIVIASIGLGSALTPPLISYIMVTWGWRVALMASSIPALLIAFLWLRSREPAHAKAEEAVKKIEENVLKSDHSKLRSRSFILLTLSYTLQGYVGYIFVTWFYLYLVQERHFGLLTGAWMSSLPWILSIVSIPLGGFLSDRLALGKLGNTWGRRLVPILGMGLSGVLISIGAHTGNPVVAAISLAFATAFILCVEGPFWSVMMTVAGSKSGTAGGIMNMGSNLGGLISPTLTPLLAAYMGWENALHLAAALAIVGAVLWFGVQIDKPTPGHTNTIAG